MNTIFNTVTNHHYWRRWVTVRGLPGAALRGRPDRENRRESPKKKLNQVCFEYLLIVYFISYKMLSKISAKHEEIKKKIHSFRIPLPRWGQRVMGKSH